MKIKTNVKADGLNTQNHNQTVGLKVKTKIKAGASDGRSYVTG